MARLLIALTSTLLGAATVQAHSVLKRSKPGDGFVGSLSFKHHLRVCNAYPYPEALDVYKGASKKLTEKPLPYKSCEDFSTPLKSGDSIQFRAGDLSAGTFSIADLPNNDCVLLLVIYRHDTLMTATAFKSHVFANLMNSQVAVIDTYKGSKRGTLSISTLDLAKGKNETLKYNTLIALNPGAYTVELTDPASKKKKASSSLITLKKESYVVLRTGVEAQAGESYPEELVVYPRSAWSSTRSMIASISIPLIGMLMLLAVDTQV